MFRGPRRIVLHRPVDLAVAVLVLVAAAPVLVLAWVAAGAAAKCSGLFRQERIGRGGTPFSIVKFRTMDASSAGSSVTVHGDERVTSIGRLLRRTKIDELPQLLNVLRGDMALLGPRPDVPGFADELTGDGAKLLDIRPGVTGPASVLFRAEEQLLTSVSDPIAFNQDIIYPLKTMVNLAWLSHGTLVDDLRLLFWTLKSPPTSEIEQLLDRWDPSLSASENYQTYLRLRGPT